MGLHHLRIKKVIIPTIINMATRERVIAVARVMVEFFVWTSESKLLDQHFHLLRTDYLG